MTQEDLPHQHRVRTDHLDFVGLELHDTFIQTKKANGDQLQSRIKNRVELFVLSIHYMNVNSGQMEELGSELQRFKRGIHL